MSTHRSFTLGIAEILIIAVVCLACALLPSWRLRRKQREEDKRELAVHRAACKLRRQRDECTQAPLRNELATKEVQIIALQEERDSLSKASTKQQAKITAQQKQITDLNASNSLLRTQLEKVERKLQSMSEECERTKENQATIKKEYDALLNRHKEQKEEQKEVKEAMELKHRHMQEALAAKQQECKKHTASLQDHAKRIEELGAEKDSLQTKLSAKEAQVQDLQEQHTKELEAKADELGSAMEAKEAEFQRELHDFGEVKSKLIDVESTVHILQAHLEEKDRLLKECEGRLELQLKHHEDEKSLDDKASPKRPPAPEHILVQRIPSFFKGRFPFECEEKLAKGDVFDFARMERVTLQGEEGNPPHLWIKCVGKGPGQKNEFCLEASEGDNLEFQKFGVTFKLKVVDAANLSMGASSYKEIDSQTEMVEMEAMQEIWELDLNPLDVEIPKCANFLKKVDSLPAEFTRPVEGQCDQCRFHQFFCEFGLHLVSKVILGGRVKFKMRLSNDSKENGHDLNTRIFASFKMLSKVKVTAGKSSKNQHLFTKFLETVKTTGGDMKGLSDKTSIEEFFTAWTASLRKKPATLFVVADVPIYQAVDLLHPKYRALEDAYNFYAYLNLKRMSQLRGRTKTTSGMSTTSESGFMSPTSPVPM